jgi:hypothetical protein
LKYFWATIRHKWFVFLASLKLGLPLWRAVIHDWSKFLPSELPYYEREFFGDKGDPDGFAIAWLRHQNRHDHHPEFWITRSDHVHGGVDGSATDGCLSMSEVAITEMVADWLGASMAYTGTWDMQDWLAENLPKKRLHPHTRIKVIDLLCARKLYMPSYEEIYPPVAEHAY